MIPNTWQELPLKTSPQFLEEIGFRGIVPSGHPISVLRLAKNVLLERFAEELSGLEIPRQRYCLLYYCGHDPYADEVRIGMDVEWWGPCEEIITRINWIRGSVLGADDADATHALVHDRQLNQWYLAPINEARQFVRENNENLN
jgi:hypothetical protein